MKSPKMIPEHATERKTVELSAAGCHECGGMTSESVCDNHNEDKSYSHYKKEKEYWFESDIGELR